MLQALNDQGEEVLSLYATRTANYRCPVCREELTFKAGAIVVPHFAHRPETGCGYGIGESLRHHEMKLQVARLFSGGEVRYEVPLGERRADLLLRCGRLSCIVECQESPLSLAEWQYRTEDYNRMGYPILWVWDLPRVLGSQWRNKAFDPHLERFEVRVPAEIRHCHKQSYGRVYVLDKAGEIRACNLGAAAERWNDGGPYWDSYSYTPRTLKIPRFCRVPLEVQPLMGSGREWLVQLGEGVWWK